MLEADEKAGHAALAMEYEHSLMSLCYGFSFLAHFRSTTDSLASEIRPGGRPTSYRGSFPIRDSPSSLFPRPPTKIAGSSRRRGCLNREHDISKVTEFLRVLASSVLDPR